MNKTVEKIKAKFEEDPFAAIASLTLAATAVVGVTNALVSAKNSRTWRREVNRRVKNSK